MCGVKASPTERTLDFATNFITSFITKKVRPEGGNASDEEDEDELPQFVTNIFKFLCEVCNMHILSNHNFCAAFNSAFLFSEYWRRKPDYQISNLPIFEQITEWLRQ